MTFSLSNKLKELLRNFLIALFVLFSFSVFSQPKMEFEKKVVKFDKVEAGTLLSFEYKFKNTGNQPLIIKDIKVSCTCTKFTFPKEPILPREPSSINVSFDTDKKVGYQDRTLDIYTNISDEPIKIRFKGVVKNDNWEK